MSNSIPQLGFGLGLRAKHYAHILEARPEIDFFEIITENYLNDEGRGRQKLARIREHYPIIMHGVSLSIGTIDPLNSDYLYRMKTLIDWLEPAWVSDHLCWTGVAHRNTHDLLPVPYTEEALAHIVERIRQVQDILGRVILLENPSTYLEFQSSAMPEEEFIARMVDASGCGLLLDVNNVYVNCFNHRRDVRKYLDALPLHRVGQMHLSGHSNHGTHIVDTHDDHVVEDVWQMYRYVIAKTGLKNTMVEWDADIPAFEVLEGELNKARIAAAQASQDIILPDFSHDEAHAISNETVPLAQEQQRLQAAILGGRAMDSAPQRWIRPKPEFAPEAQLQVYSDAYRIRLCDAVAENFPVLRHYLGDEKTDALIRDYVEATPSHFYDAAFYPEAFPSYLARHLDDGFAHELAALEQAIAMLSAQAESDVLTPAHLEGFTAETLMDAQLKPRAAHRLLAFRHNVNDYYSAVVLEETLPAIVPEASAVMCYRHEDELWRLPLDMQEHALLARLCAGAKVGTALEEAGADEAAIGAWFGKWMQHGLLAA